jgi:hypothetical protein
MRGYCLPIIAAFVALSLSARPGGAVEFAGGTGEPNDPYQIATAAQLLGIGSDPNLLNKRYLLINDIDLDPNLPGGRVFFQAVIAPGRTTWGRFMDVPFIGDFDGNGHWIMNPVFRGENPFSGLFGEIGRAGRVHDLMLTGVCFENRFASNGSPLASSNRGTISRCRTSGFVCGRGRLGGLVSLNNGFVNSCRSDCTVQGTMWDGPIGSTILGGLIGYNESGTVLDCYATGDVSGIYEYGGGLVGNNDGIVNRCYARGAVSMTTIDYQAYTGGLAGATSRIWFPPGSGSVRHCFWDMDTAGQVVSSGGFGRTTAQMIHAATFAGWGPEWTIEEGQDYPRLAWEQAGGTPLQNHPARTYDGRGDANEPFLLRNTDDLLCMMSRSEDWNATFEICNDIDMKGVPFLPPACFGGVLDGRGHKIANLAIHENSEFLGLIESLEGGMVRDLFLSEVDIEGHGLIGGLAALSRGGCITGCAMTGRIVATVVERDGYESYGAVGGLVGSNYQGYVGKCFAMPRIICTSPASVGGLVALNHGSIACNWAMSDISISRATEYAGGFVGVNGASIINCHSAGRIVQEGSTEDGESCGYIRCISGFVACSSGPISHCYASARVSPGDPICTVAGGFLPDRLDGGNVMACFWDTQASGIDDVGKDPATGKPTAQMYEASTFQGWDFDGVWTICEGRDYPRLRWEGAACEP